MVLGCAYGGENCDIVYLAKKFIWRYKFMSLDCLIFMLFSVVIYEIRSKLINFEQS